MTTQTKLLSTAIKILADQQRLDDADKLARQQTRATVGKIMLSIRLSSGLSIRETARRLRCSAVFLSDMEKGRRHQTIEWVRKLEKAIRNQATP